VEARAILDNELTIIEVRPKFKKVRKNRRHEFFNFKNWAFIIVYATSNQTHVETLIIILYTISQFDTIYSRVFREAPYSFLKNKNKLTIEQQLRRCN